MTGQIKVGYNNREFLKKEGISLLDTAITSENSAMLLQKTIFKFPVTLYPGQIIGGFEALFSEPFSFYYKTTVDGGDIDAFFIRRVNIKRIMKESEKYGDLTIKFR